MAEINAVDISELMSKWGKKGGRFVPKRKLLLPGEILRCDRSRNQRPRQLPNLVQFRTSNLRPFRNQKHDALCRYFSRRESLVNKWHARARRKTSIG